MSHFRLKPQLKFTFCAVKITQKVLKKSRDFAPKLIVRVRHFWPHSRGGALHHGVHEGVARLPVREVRRMPQRVLLRRRHRGAEGKAGVLPIPGSRGQLPRVPRWDDLHRHVHSNTKCHSHAHQLSLCLGTCIQTPTATLTRTICLSAQATTLCPTRTRRSG